MILVEPKDIELLVEATTESWTDGRSATGGKINAAQVTAYIKKMINKTAPAWIGSHNDATTRAGVQQQIQKHLQYIWDRGGLAEYKVTCDENNNPPDLIDDGKLQLDVYIKPKHSISFVKIEAVVGRQGVQIP